MGVRRVPSARLAIALGSRAIVAGTGIQHLENGGRIFLSNGDFCEKKIRSFPGKDAIHEISKMSRTLHLTFQLPAISFVGPTVLLELLPSFFRGFGEIHPEHVTCL